MKKLSFILLSVALLFSHINKAQIATFNYTGGSQNYVVPAGVTVICFTVSGAQGMRNAQGSNLGGLGGRVTGSMPVTPGQVLQINVGGGGLVSTVGGFNGGGNGGIITTACCNNAHAGGGGGASDIRIAPYGLVNRVAVGGGGGGTGGNRVVGCAPGTGGGGGGGYYGGGGGGAYGGSPGAGGSQVAGGAGGASCCGCPLTPQPGAAGALGNGGNGGNLGGCNNQAANNPGCAGGIGGALVGGMGPNCTNGTGCPSTWAGASGGGGSNFAGGAVIGPVHFAGVQTGHGQVIIQPNCCLSPTIIPVANPNPICVGNTATLTATGAGTGGTYTWTPGPVTGSQVTVSPSVTTIYTVSGSTTLNCVGTQTIQLNVNPLPVVTPGNNSPVCSGGTINLSVNAASTYTWSGPNGFSSNLQNPTITNASTLQSGNYTVAVTNANGCTNTAVTTVTVNPTPTISAGNTGPYCQGATISLSVSAASAYAWSGPNGFNSNLQNPSIANSQTVNAGVYNVTITLATGCTATGSTAVIVHPSPNPTITSNSPVCLGSQLNLFGLGGVTYTWTGPNNFNTTTQNPSIATTSLVNAGNYTLTVTNANGCTNSVVSNIVINTLPTITVNNPTVCLGSNFTLTATGGTAYAWTGPSAFTSNQQDPVLSNAQFNMSGNYTVLVTSGFGCTNTAVSSASVFALPNVSITGLNVICSQNFNGSVNTSTLFASGASNYTWSIPPGFNALPNLNSNIITVNPPVIANPSIETMTLIGMAGTCTNIALYNISVIPNPTVSVISSSMCAGLSATLIATGADNYFWTPNINLSSNTGSLVVSNPNISMIYSVYGSSAGCNSPSQSASVNVVPLPVITISPATATMCAGTSIALYAFGATNYTWEPSGSLNNAFSSVVNASPVGTTNYTVIGSMATCTSSAIRQVSVITLPTLQAIVSQSSICQGDFATFNANGANNYTWSPGVGLSDPFSNFVTANPNQTTVYTLIGNNGVCSASLQVTLHVAPKPNTQLSASSQKICEGNAATIFAAGADSYSWSPVNSLNLLNAGTAIASPSVSTNYTVVGINYAGPMTCVHTKEIFIEVVPTIAGSISGSVQICEGESTRLYAGGSNTYRWYPPSSLSNTNAAQPYANPKSTTVYTVFISNDGNCAVTQTVLVNVTPQPTVYAGRDTIFNLDEPMYLNAKGTGTLTWIAGEGILCKDCPNTQIMPKNSGCYTILAINEAGCKATDDVCVEITKDYNLYIPNSFTPNYDGLNDVFKVHGTGIFNIEIYIFDRWGEKLFYTTDFEKGWDGTLKGEVCKEDTYVYLVNFTSLSGKVITRTGHVTLMK
jgi:gliding motility-associated-like protein